jgi:hypothetical protein
LHPLRLPLIPPPPPIPLTILGHSRPELDELHRSALCRLTGYDRAPAGWDQRLTVRRGFSGRALGTHVECGQGGRAIVESSTMWEFVLTSDNDRGPGPSDGLPRPLSFSHSRRIVAGDHVNYFSWAPSSRWIASVMLRRVSTIAHSSTWDAVTSPMN